MLPEGLHLDQHIVRPALRQQCRFGEIGLHRPYRFVGWQPANKPRWRQQIRPGRHTRDRAARHWPRSGLPRGCLPAGSPARPCSTGHSPELAARLPAGTSVNLKLELFQHTGSFKARGALAVMLGLAPDALARGVTAVSAGNHAIATAWAARELGTHAKVVMLASANPARVARRTWLRRRAGDGDRRRRVLRHSPSGSTAEEGRAFVHPFEGPLTARGTGTVGLEWLEQSPRPRRGPGAGWRRWPAGRDRLRGQAAPPGLPGHRRRARGCRQHVAQLRRRRSAAARARRHHRRQPGCSLCAALQLRPVPSVRGRDRADRGRGDGRRHAPRLRDAEADPGAGRCRGHRRAARAIAGAVGGQARGRAGVRLQHRRGHLPSPCGYL